MKPTAENRVDLEVFQGHIVLLCKGHYDYDCDFFEAIGRIWAIRCGWDYEHFTDDTYEYIADDMYNIILQCFPDNLRHIQRNIHKNLTWSIGRPKDLTPIKALIWEYRSVISGMQIKEKPEGRMNYRFMVKLPRPKRNIFNRILRGDGKYKDYWRIEKKTPKVLSS